MDPVCRLLRLAGLCFRPVSDAYREPGVRHVLGFYCRKHFLLRGGYHAGLSVQGQSGFLQIRLSDYSISEADELLFPVSCEMRQGEVHIMRKMQTRMPDECGRNG